MGWDDTAKNCRPVSNIRASKNYFHPEDQEIQPFIYLFIFLTITLSKCDTDPDAVVTAIALPVFSYISRLKKKATCHRQSITGLYWFKHIYFRNVYIYNTYKNTTIGLERKHKSLFSSFPKLAFIVSVGLTILAEIIL